MRLLFVALPALMLAGCGGGTSEQAATNQPEIAVRSDEQNQLHQLSDLNRDIALKRAILASGLRCKRVIRSGYVTEFKKLSMWQADCDDKRSWGIFVGADGSAQVRPCTDNARFKLPECKIAQDPSGRTARGIAKAG
jgi:2-succinyl-5-enolpyruvyl-6-hydroxy-3-cyclohexene-1-carboxylate synthase